ncbi:uncharacterized protein LOC111557256 [Felis catus]|uniref:uncharacterized protein LOC111557256 n=1 Tax=Felis catus TaxID=9685 RepID=UPI001D19F212|nr:uncharacterized protein LOC111557256 [Felis catus]
MSLLSRRLSPGVLASFLGGKLQKQAWVDQSGCASMCREGLGPQPPAGCAVIVTPPPPPPAPAAPVVTFLSWAPRQSQRDRARDFTEETSHRQLRPELTVWLSRPPPTGTADPDRRCASRGTEDGHADGQTGRPAPVFTEASRTEQTDKRVQWRRASEPSPPTDIVSGPA